MQRALELARRAPPTSPNPAVGAVVVSRDGSAIAEGGTEPPPGAHAEEMALRQAGAAARGAILFVKLEACNHQRRTPPSTRPLNDAGVTQVQYTRLGPDT